MSNPSNQCFECQHHLNPGNGILTDGRRTVLLIGPRCRQLPIDHLVLCGLRWTTFQHPILVRLNSVTAPEQPQQLEQCPWERARQCPRTGAQLGGRERGIEPRAPSAQKWRSYNYSKFDEFFGELG